MAGARKKRTSSITSDSIRRMLVKGGATIHHFEMTPKNAKALMEELVILNGRWGDKMDGKKDFAFSKDGRFDSFTAACNGLEQAETLYRFPFRTDTDHLFLYTKESYQEPSIHAGYALFIKGGRLFYLTAWLDDDNRLVSENVSAVDPGSLLDFLNSFNKELKDDTVSEQMRWVQEAQKHGLLAPAYPQFVGGLAKNGQGEWLVLLLGTPLPTGFIKQFD